MGRIRLALIGAGAFVGITLLFAAPFAVGAYLDGRRGERAALEAIELAQSNDLRGATARLTAARRSFDGAASKLGAPLVAPAKLIPGVGRQLRTAHGLARAGGLSAGAALQAARALDAKPPGGWIRDGSVDLSAVGRAAAAVSAAAPLAAEAAETMDQVPGSFLFPPLSRARAAAADRITSGATSIDKAVAGLGAARGFLGAEGPKRYLVFFSNLAELRGTGGFYGFHAFLTAEGGRLSIGEAGRPRDDLPSIAGGEVAAPEWFRNTWGPRGAFSIWQDLNLSSDFPTVGRIASHAAGTDGVIQVDALGIASLLRLTGPVTLETWPVPITADNVARVASHDVYVRYTDEPRRDAFGEELLVNVFRRALAGGLDIGAAAFTELGRATSGGHLQVFANDTSHQAALTKLGVAWGLSRANDATDVVGAYSLSADASKQDYFLRRELEYTVTLDPDKNTATTELQVLLKDTMPARGEPRYVMGSGYRGTPPLDNRSALAIVRPLRTQAGQISADGTPLQVSHGEDAGLRTQLGYMVVPNGRSVRVRAESLVPNALEGTGNVRTYRLRLLHQPTLSAGRYWVRINAPAGWRVDQHLVDGMQTRDEVIEVQVRRSAPSWLAAQVRRPWRSLFG